MGQSLWCGMGPRVEKQGWLGGGERGSGSWLDCILHGSEFLGTRTRGMGPAYGRSHGACSDSSKQAAAKDAAVATGMTGYPGQLVT